jgi:hypothetical protein
MTIRALAVSFIALWLAPLAACHAASSAGGGGAIPPAGGASTPPPAGSPSSTPAAGTPAPAASPGTQLETFEGTLPDADFAVDPVPDDGPWADAGVYFTNQGIHPPPAFRVSQPFGADGWLTLESYTRSAGAHLSDFASIVPDPADPTNHVLQIRSPAHTDATVVRPTRPLPARYKVTLRVGFPHFGDGVPPNGYRGGERAEPWLDADATGQNGFYWLTILDAMPRPHNNVWIHHHRKVVVDSDNNTPPWMEMWNGTSFEWSGVHPIMMIALDGKSSTDRTGNAFYSWSAGQWQPSGDIRAVDAYLPDHWYQVSITRDGPRYTLEISGEFAHGGQTTYTATVDAAATCTWHYPVDATEAAGAGPCVDESSSAALGPGAPPNWPAGASWPDWFMFGDPHENFYEGDVLYDDVKLEIPST